LFNFSNYFSYFQLGRAYNLQQMYDESADAFTQAKIVCQMRMGEFFLLLLQSFFTVTLFGNILDNLLLESIDDPEEKTKVENEIRELDELLPDMQTQVFSFLIIYNL